jgi:hypothetical protein
VNEPGERYAARGPKGDQGERGAAGPSMTPGARHAVIFLFCLSVALAGFCLIFTAHAVSSNNRKWCSTIVLIDDAYRSRPPSTPTGRKLAGDFGVLRREFGCG